MLGESQRWKFEDDFIKGMGLTKFVAEAPGPFAWQESLCSLMPSLGKLRQFHVGSSTPDDTIVRRSNSMPCDQIF